MALGVNQVMVDAAGGPSNIVVNQLLSASRGMGMDRRKRAMALITRMMRRKNGKTAGWKRMTSRYGITTRDERDAENGVLAVIFEQWLAGADAEARANMVADEFFRFNTACARGNFDPRNGNKPNRVGW